jgi:hypothetical protein
MLPRSNIHGKPSATAKMIIDMFASLDPSILWLAHPNDLGTEAAPETHTVIVFLPAALELLCDLSRV